eukprot:TRINITY_DN5667_c0_g1_i3.p1 TRINITY_DN5667_c0_g1~~TRINITY_DN5667_c0_g1_i3.p1  ORF type:complete len:487 (+),score=115.79 TRINITY_DN5667_c0_g1_i3:64-1524(+)
MGCCRSSEASPKKPPPLSLPPPAALCPEVSDADFESADEGSQCDGEEAGAHAEEFLHADLHYTWDVYGFNAGPGSPQERLQIGAMRSELAEDLAAAPQHPELLSDWKMLRFLRGHHTVPEACSAFRNMLAYRKERNVDQAREELLAGVLLPNNRLDVARFTDVKWPYTLPKFERLRKHAWDGLMPCVNHGTDALGNPLTFTYFRYYNLNGVVNANLQDLWLRLSLYCDVYSDLLLHELSVQTGRMIARHDIVDADGVGPTTMGTSAIRLIGRVGESSEQYPEMIVRTTAVNFGGVELAVFNNLIKPFLPEQTISKFAAHGTEYELQAIPQNTRPAKFKGTCDCALCKVLAHHWTCHKLNSSTPCEQTVRIAARSHRVVFELECSSAAVLGCTFVHSTGEEQLCSSKTLEGQGDGKWGFRAGFESRSGGELKFSVEHTGFFSAEVKHRLQYSLSPTEGSVAQVFRTINGTLENLDAEGPSGRMRNQI